MGLLLSFVLDLEVRRNSACECTMRLCFRASAHTRVSFACMLRILFQRMGTGREGQVG
jgi:hypothetical protein